MIDPNVTANTSDSYYLERSGSPEQAAAGNSSPTEGDGALPATEG